MKPPTNLIGRKFGRLTPVEYLGWNDGRAQWKCECDCGKETVKDHYALLRGDTTSCGCLRKSKDCKNYKHGLHKHRIYRIHNGMKQRCFNSKNPDYKNYGARGITICDEWLGENGFINFYNWALKNGYSDSLSIDRKKNDGNYCPENCRWIDRKTQQNNTRFNRKVSYNGETHTYAEWESLLNNGVTQIDISHRIKNGWDVERALLTPKRHFKKANKYYWDKKIVCNGKSKSILEWCNENGIDKRTYRHRIRAGWSEEKASTLPKQPGLSGKKRG